MYYIQFKYLLKTNLNYSYVNNNNSILKMVHRNIFKTYTTWTENKALKRRMLDNGNFREVRSCTLYVVFVMFYKDQMNMLVVG